MTTFPTIPASQWVQRLEHPGRKIRLVLDTDAFNEIDDPFAIAYAPERSGSQSAHIRGFPMDA